MRMSGFNEHFGTRASFFPKISKYLETFLLYNGQSLLLKYYATLYTMEYFINAYYSLGNEIQFHRCVWTGISMT